jgi:hypothetical protein
MIFLIEIFLYLSRLSVLSAKSFSAFGIRVLLSLLSLILPSYYIPGCRSAYAGLSVILDELSFWIGFASVVVVFLSLVV